MFLHLAIFILVNLTTALCAINHRPNIVFILVDDLGWNDVGFHGSSQIPTPNLDALAFSGVSLSRYYVTPLCTPSRAALMTGKYPIHTGMQHGWIYGMEPRGLPLSEKILPQYLKELGYSNYMVGKWHLGHFKKEYTPLYRGFDSHLGFWVGHQDYYDHTAVESGVWGLDMRRNMSVAFDLHGQYSTDVVNQETLRLIRTHDKANPFFLYIAHTAVHSGNPSEPLRAPDDTIAKFESIENYQRRKFTAMMSKVDDSIGDLVKELDKQGVLNNTIIVFSTDNGGAPEGFNMNAGSNWPLRGVKNTLWEGGIRGAGMVWSQLIEKRQRVAHQPIHISDWLPTLYEAAGGDPKNLSQIDGISMWQTISKDRGSGRTRILHNIDDIYGNSALTVNKWKLVNGTTFNGDFDGWFGPSGDRAPETYSYNKLRRSDVGQILYRLGLMPTKPEVTNLRAENSVDCHPSGSVTNQNTTTTKCEPLRQPCLFDILADPCELNNLAGRLPAVLSTMLKELEKFRKTAVPPNNKELDRRAEPKNFHYVWSNFGDSE